MAIGEFGGAPAVPGGEHGILLSTPLYWLYEMSHAALNPSRAWADATRLFFKNPVNPLSFTTYGKTVAAACELFERSTRRYGKPEWRVSSALVGGERVPINIHHHGLGTAVLPAPAFRARVCTSAEAAAAETSDRRADVGPFRHAAARHRRGVSAQSRCLHHRLGRCAHGADIAAQGRFDLDDYIDYVISILHVLGGDTHVVAVCQPSVPVLAAVAVMEADDDPYAPTSMILMGGPIDTRVNPTGVNDLAKRRGIDWFRTHVITKVPFPNPGFHARRLSQGFLQLNGFVSMNLDRRIEAHEAIVPQSGEGRRRFRAQAQGILRRISCCHGPVGRVLSADSRYGVRETCAAQGAR